MGLGYFYCRDRDSNNPIQAAGGRNTWGPRKAGFAGKGEAKTQVEFSACGKCNIVACALTKRVAAVGVQRSPAVGKAHTGHRKRTPAYYTPLNRPLFDTMVSARVGIVIC